MDSPIRTTKPEDKHNIREEFRGGMLREVWDELDENGQIVKTAVWDVLDRSGNPLGEQSWDEYEHYIDVIREQALEAKRPGRKSKLTKAERDLKRAEAKARKEERSLKNRNDITAIFEYYLEEHPEPFPQIPTYRVVDLIMPYAEKLGLAEFTHKKFSVVVSLNKEYFESLGFTFSKGWSIYSRNICTYMGYRTTMRIDEKHKKESRDESIISALESVEKGTYKRTDMARVISSKIAGINPSNLSWILVRNARKFGLTYDYSADVITKEG